MTINTNRFIIVGGKLFPKETQARCFQAGFLHFWGKLIGGSMDITRKDADEQTDKAYKDSTVVDPPEKQPAKQDLRSGGVSNVKPDEALRGEAENKRLQENPPPLVHVDPSTGKPIDKPFTPSAEPNRLTTPGANPSNPNRG